MRPNPKVKAAMVDIKRLAKKHGEEVLCSAANKWTTGIRDRKKLHKQQKVLERELKEVSRKLA